MEQPDTINLLLSKSVALKRTLDRACAGRQIVIDIELFSPVEIEDTSTSVYASHPETKVLCVGYAVDDGPVKVWWPGQPIPSEIFECVADTTCKWAAFPASFERAIWREKLIALGWPAVPSLERWICIQSMALALALPAELKLLGKVLNLPEQKADAKIMLRMSKPRPPLPGEDPEAGPYRHSDPESLQALGEYLAQDVATERAALRWLLPLPPIEQKRWQHDQVINERGVYINVALFDPAIAIATEAKNAAQDRLRASTGGVIETVGQHIRFKSWLETHSCEVKDCERETLAHVLRARSDLLAEVREAIQARLEASGTAAGKFQALRARREPDGRVRYAFRFHGAATGRWSCRGVQFQNFKRDAEHVADKLAAVRTGDIEAVCQLGVPLDVIGDLARTAICAAPGHRLLIGDFSGIESRVLAWLAGDLGKLALWAKFDQTKDPLDDPYYILGCLLGFPPETARKYGKIADLAFGYGGGIPAWRNFAPLDDTTTDEQILVYRNAWRDRHPPIVKFWYGFDANQYRTGAAIQAMRNAPQPVQYGRLQLRCEPLNGVPFFFMRLPSGRSIAYPFATLIQSKYGHPAISFMDNKLGRWVEYSRGEAKIKGLWGGPLAENATQGVACDLLSDAMQRLGDASYQIVFHVHDEIIVEVPEGFGSDKEFQSLIEQLPAWAT